MEEAVEVGWNCYWDPNRRVVVEVLVVSNNLQEFLYPAPAIARGEDLMGALDRQMTELHRRHSWFLTALERTTGTPLNTRYLE